MNELHIYPTSRAIRQTYEHQKLNVGFMPSLMRMDEFESRAIIIDGKVQVDKLQRILLLKNALTLKSIDSLKIDTNLVRFFTKSDAIFKFFEELSAENVQFDVLRQSDAYAEFVEHIDLLENIYDNYQDILTKKGLYDKSFIPKLYTINKGFISSFTKIKIYLEGYLSRFEMTLLDEVSKITSLEIEYITSEFNYKMQDRFSDYGIELPQNSKVIFDFTLKRVIQSSLNSHSISSRVYSVEQRVEQVSVVFEEVQKMVDSGIKAEKIVVVVPDESFTEYLFAYDKNNNLNFAMGFNYSSSKLFKILEAIQSYWKSFDNEDLKLIKFYGIDSAKVDISLSNKSSNIDEFFNYLDLLNMLDEFESHKEISLLKMKFIRVFNTDIFELNQWLFLWIKVLKDVRVDDTNGGLITVMGVLETRGIEFDGVILIDFNEGVVPSTLKKDQFLNSSVREFAGLPTIKDRESLQKHYYSRLLENAKMSSIVYVSSESSLPSKFLFELGLDRGKSYLVAKNIFYNSHKLVEIDDPIVKNFDATKMVWSSSRLSTYLRCKRKFYYKYIENIKEKDSDELNDGEFLHKVLENIHTKSYDTFEEINMAIAKEIDILLPSNNSVLNYKKMLFKEKLKGYGAWSIEHFSDGWKVLFREKEYETKIGSLKFRGRIDRVDTNGFKILVLDYKSGNVNKDKKEFIPEEQTDFQMSIYGRFLKGKYQEIEFAYVKILENGKLVYPTHLAEKDQLLESVSEDIKNTKSFRASKCEDLKECKYCEYQLLCKRGEYL